MLACQAIQISAQGVNLHLDLLGTTPTKPNPSRHNEVLVEVPPKVRGTPVHPAPREIPRFNSLLARASGRPKPGRNGR